MIVLINPVSTASDRKPLPMSLLALGAVLEGEFDYRIVDGNIEPNVVEHVVRIASGTTLTAIGLTVMPGPQLQHAVRTTRALAARLPGVPIVWGGYFPSQHARACLSEPAIEYCVRGQGERTFLQLMRVLTTGGPLDGIPGLSYREGAAIRENPVGPLAPLDQLPTLPYHRVALPRYLQSHYLGARVAAHHSSYGCPFACNFCAVVEFAQRRWVAESPARVEQVVRWFKTEHGADAMQFYDMDFFISEPRTLAIAERIAPLGMTWWGLGRVDELMRYRTTTWQTMTRSGLKMVFCGAESGSTDTLIRMNKGGAAAAEMTLDLARRMKEFGVVPELSFVVGNPPDPEGDLRQTLAFIKRLKTINSAAEIILYVYAPVPGSSRDFPFPETLDDWMSDRWQSFALRRDPRTPWSPPTIRSRVRDFETVLNAYYPTVTDVRLTPGRRALLKAASAWRYHTGQHRRPIELNFLQRAFRYQRPETTGF